MSPNDNLNPQPFATVIPPKVWQTCPVCQGRTWVHASFYEPPPNPNVTAAIVGGTTQCRSCFGRGIV